MIRRPASRHNSLAAAILLALATAALPGCGGGSGTSPSPQAPGPSPSPSPTPLGITETTTFAGAANPNCQLGGHDFDAAEGDITLTLVETTGGVGLYGQVCAGGVDSGCTISQTPMAVGQTLTGVRRGIARQNVKMLTLNCGSGPVPPAPVAYTIRVTYRR